VIHFKLSNGGRDWVSEEALLGDVVELHPDHDDADARKYDEGCLD